MPKYCITVTYRFNKDIRITFSYRFKLVRNIVYKLIKNACSYCEVDKWHIVV